MPVFKKKGARVRPSLGRENLLSNECSAFEKSQPKKQENSSDLENICPCKTSWRLTPERSVDPRLQNTWLKCRISENFARPTTITDCAHSEHFQPVGKESSFEASGKQKSPFKNYKKVWAKEQCTSKEAIKTSLDIKTTIAHDQRDFVTLKCRWFPDVDKLDSLKPKYSSHSNKKEPEKDDHEWLSEPKKIYRSIQSQRRKKVNLNWEMFFDHRETHVEIAEKSKQNIEKRVCFSSEVLFLLAIEDNFSGQLKELILSNNVDINKSISHKGFSPLHRAVELGHSDCVSILLFHGANVDAKDIFGRSPIDIALSNKHFECMVLLIEYGANIAEFTNRKLQEFRNVKEFLKTSCKLLELEI